MIGFQNYKVNHNNIKIKIVQKIYEYVRLTPYDLREFHSYKWPKQQKTC